MESTRMMSMLRKEQATMARKKDQELAEEEQRQLDKAERLRAKEDEEAMAQAALVDLEKAMEKATEAAQDHQTRNQGSEDEGTIFFLHIF